MVKQYTGKQYDDDLTIGSEDYDDSYYTGSADFFEFATDDESPISRLKSLILSIDWEITDEILMQFNEELIDLRDIWAGEKINLVYVQALEKISKYIYQKKANSHPSAIKLLLTLYHNLEKIVSSYDLSEEQKKAILLEDVKRFESLKRHIGQHSQAVDLETQADKPQQQKKTENISSEKDLLGLKAIVLGIDWEITNQDLNALRQEVDRLEHKFADSRPKCILLQGLGTLGAYIKLKKSNSHADAFKLLHLFYESIEKIVATARTLEEEKAILFPAVERFNSFKKLLGPTITAEAINREEEEAEESDSTIDSMTLAPAFADLPEEIKGFQAEEEAQADGIENSGTIDNQVENFFMGESFKNQVAENSPGSLSASDEEMHKMALQGVNVEVDDEDMTDGLLFGKESPAPALSHVNEEEEDFEISPVLEEESLTAENELILEDSLDWPAEKIAGRSEDANTDDDDTMQTGIDFSTLDPALVLQGVDVETEADDESDEEALPQMGGELAPALAENDEISIYNATIFEKSSSGENIDEEIAGTLGGFFDEEIASHLTPDPAGDKETDQIASLADDLQEEEEQNNLYDEEKIAVLQEDTVSSQDSKEAVSDDNFAMVSEDEQEEDSTEINERLDSFFDLEEDAVPTDEDIFLHAEPEAIEGSIPVKEKILSPIADGIEEEVIFELVEEETQLAEIVPAPGETDLPISLIDSIERTDMFQSLQICADALGVELDEKVIVSLWQEINTLDQNLTDKPMERTFLQLLSTVTRHIDQNRYDSSTEAYELLQSICTALNTLPEGNLQYNQEMLLAETHKVLQWQEELFHQLAAKNEAELTIGGEGTAEESLCVDEAQVRSFDGEETKRASDGLHQEISTLRQNLQDEIAELRKGMKDT